MRGYSFYYAYCHSRVLHLTPTLSPAYGGEGVRSHSFFGLWLGSSSAFLWKKAG